MAKQIPIKLQDDERIVRGIFHPYHVKKGKIKREAFTPPKHRNDVSTMRLDYASPDTCKLHLKALEASGKTFQGVAAFKVTDVKDVNSRRAGRVAVEMKATPLNEYDIERSQEETILDTDPGNPFHADILYSDNLTDEAEPKTEIRILAEELRKRVIYFKDESDAETWEGDALHIFR